MSDLKNFNKAKLMSIVNGFFITMCENQKRCNFLPNSHSGQRIYLYKFNSLCVPDFFKTHSSYNDFVTKNFKDTVYRWYSPNMKKMADIFIRRRLCLVSGWDVTTPLCLCMHAEIP